ncbi:MAG: UvrD-helicase domain-containing protein [Kiritimatiellae bacterium]|nr:UvrD-helicase domain-containing protein [Kiritimatiellia bacterium]
MCMCFNEQIFDPSFPMDGPHLVAASAGTGKTYNIQNIYARLVAEKGFRTSQIQVMTFTEKATKELRDRVRKVLANLSLLFAGREDEILDGDGKKDEHEIERLNKLRDCARATIGGESADAVARAQIELALMEFDQAAITTIHGFCHRALVRFAFETNSAFKSEFADTKAQDLARRVRDWWRCKRQAIPDAVKDGVDIGTLQAYVTALSGKTGWALDTGDDDDPRTFTLARAKEIVAAYEADRPARTTQTYDDLLRSLRDALLDKEKGPALAACLRDEFKAALVDEFQDTDPVQYDIFRLVFLDPAIRPAPTLFFVGDPKQAIYSFRGGDIYTYKKAVTDPAVKASTFHLDQNFRSTPRLIDAVNALFMDKKNGNSYVRTFGDDAIGYPSPLRSSDKEPLKLPDGTPDPSPFRIVMARKAGERSQAVIDTVLTVLEEQRGSGITPKDIAILTTSNDAGAEFRNALHAVNVPAVLQRAGNVFAGQMANDFRQVLMAMAQEGGRGQVRSALLTSLFSPDEAKLEDESFLADMIGFFSELNQIWLTRGLNAALAALENNKECDFRRKLAGRPDGERLLADLMQIIDLADAAVKELGPAPETLVDWLTERINQSGDDDSEKNAEEYARQLESENDALKIMTIHVAKGLEFQIVIVPMTKGMDVEPPYFYHDAKMNLHVAADDKACEKAKSEHDAERMRLLYVALTRATKRTVLVTTAPDPDSPLGRLLENARHNGAGENSTGSPIAWTEYEPPEPPLPPHGGSPSGIKAEDLSSAKVPRPYSTLPTKGSYSSLSPGEHEVRDDEFDFDSTASDSKSESADGILAMPGGTKTGTCWHDILERLPFDADDATILTETRRALSVHGLTSSAKDADKDTSENDAKLVAGMIKSTLECPLHAPDGTTFSLRDIGWQDRFSEWEFDFSSAASASTTAAIAAILREEWSGDKSRQAFLDALEGWNRHIPKGFLKGFLDLVFRKNGYHYVVDWKSNSLTRQIADFTETGITAEMATAGYFFQYLLYSAVLHRFLKETMGADYSWERNFGGVRYYFLRGIPSNGEKSVFSDRPSETLLDKLCAALGLEG